MRQPTAEQSQILSTTVPVLKIQAGAGTGKSTTLEMYAESHKVKAYYIAFNKSIADEAAAKFPKNVICKTSHSIAFGAVGRVYGNIPQKLQGAIRPFHVESLLFRTHKDLPQPLHNLYSGRVLEALNRFLVSDSNDILLTHVYISDAPAEKKYFDSSRILSDAKLVWMAMQDKNNSEVPMLHDGYLKLYQLSNPSLPADLILFDEAQDTNPVTQSIIARQQANKIYVGDKDQAIYSFRGAENAMEKVIADITLPLMGSFRFGPEIAAIANKILDIKTDERFPIRGLAAPSVVSLEDFDPSLQNRAFISRGNAALFDHAVLDLNTNKPFSFVGDIRGYRFDLILDAFNLKQGEYVRDPFIRSFSNYAALEEYAENMGDREISSRCRIVNKYDSEIPHLIEDITRKAQPALSTGKFRPDVDVLTTAHKSKGLEFDNVTLSEDFPSFFDEDGNLKDLDKNPTFVDEVNLQYVATTRAKKALKINNELQIYLSYLGDNPVADLQKNKPGM